MSKYERLARITEIEGEPGVFRMTLVTEGEASDGHILSIKGGQIPDRMPLLLSHWNDPTDQLGSITEPSKHLKDAPPRLRATGHIEMDGEGPKAEIRRDLANMIAKGHVTAVSVRWDDVPGKAIRRVNLPGDHPYYVDESKAKGPERYGYFFEEWVAREGSVVALGADPEALIGRAAECGEEHRSELHDFWVRMSVEAERGIADPPDESPAAKIAASLAALRIDASDCLKAGASHADCINAVTDTSDGKIEAIDIDDFVLFCSEPVASVLRLKLGTSTDSEFAIEEQEASLEELEHLQERLDAVESKFAALEGAVSEPSPSSETAENGRENPCEPPAQTTLKPTEFIDAVIAQLRAAHQPPDRTENPHVVRPSEVVRALERGIDQAWERVQEKRRVAIREARGEI